MAAQFVMVCLLAASLTQPADARSKPLCDPTEVTAIQHGMITCRMKLGTGTGDFCIRYAEYTTCIGNLLDNCLYSSVHFTSSMLSAPAVYSSQLEKCSSYASGSGNEKASASDPQNSGIDLGSSSQAGPSRTPAEVETTIMAVMQISDPLAFELDRYVEAVKKATRITQLPKAVVKEFKILVKYVLPNAILVSGAKAAIAKASNVLDSQVQVTQSSARRLRAGRRLALNIVDVTITVPDKSQAAAVQKSAADVAALESGIDGHVSVANAPVTTAKVETKVQSASSVAARLGSQIEHGVSDVDGTIMAWWLVKDEGTIPAPPPSSCSSNVNIVLAALLILLRAI